MVVIFQRKYSPECRYSRNCCAVMTCQGRVTSYPTADRFVKGLSVRRLHQALSNSGDKGLARPYRCRCMCIPFCESLCYLRLQQIITKHHRRGASTCTI